jgi:hypothetical protein
MRRIVIRLTDRKTGEVTFEGERVHRGLPCPVCTHLHRRQSWCLVDSERGLAICPRVQSSKAIGSAGWLHATDGSEPNLAPVNVETSSAPDELPDMAELFRSYRRDPDALEASVELLSAQWGIPADAIHRLRPGWDAEHRRHLFPMRGWTREGRWTVCGIRTRSGSRKAAIRGSRNGLIVPEGVEKPDRRRDLYVVEGESDLAAAVSLGLQAVARPGCLAVESLAVRYCAGCEVVIVRDNDGPGREGADRLRLLMKGRAKSVAVVEPPRHFKDLRDWAQVCRGPAVIEAKVRGLRGF